MPSTPIIVATPSKIGPSVWITLAVAARPAPAKNAFHLHSIQDPILYRVAHPA